MRNYLLLLLACLPLAASAQSSRFSLNGDFLTRGEIRKGGITDCPNPGPDQDLAAFVLGRARFTTLYDWTAAGAQTPMMQLKVSAQYSGIWGSVESNGISVSEAWMQLNFGKGFFTKLGRQYLSYDDQRIFGSDDWSMTGISHDVVKLGFEAKGHKAHLILAFNQNGVNTAGGTYFTGGLQPYKAMEALWYHYDFQKIPLGVSLLFSNFAMQSDVRYTNVTTFQQQMAGVYLNFHPKHWTVEAAYYRQFGTADTGIPIQAWLGSAKTVFRPSDNWAFRLGYDHLSGDSDFAVPPSGMIGITQHKVLRGFNSLYGSHNSFYGAMDFFYVKTFVSGFTPGLQNLFVGACWKPVSSLSLDLALHYLATSASLKGHDKTLGYELEMSASYAIQPWLTLNAAYSFMQGTETMDFLERSTDNKHLHWAWIMLQATPKFLNP